MKILLYLNNMRSRMGGGSIAMWTIMEELEKRGHFVAFACRQPSGEREIRGRLIHRQPEGRTLRAADVIFTSPEIIKAEGNRLRGIPTVCFVHSAVNTAWRSGMHGAGLYVWGSQSLLGLASADGWSTEARQIVMWPPIFRKRLRTTPGDHITLVNLSPEKGSEIFFGLAERMPDLQFLGVEGGWSTRSYRRRGALPPNVSILEYQQDPREVYRRTRVLLYPKSEDAHYFLYGVGMAALEAACSGIPTVAFGGPGLRESLGGGGTFLRTFRLDNWEGTLRWVLQNWDDASRAAKRRAQTHLNPDRDIRRLERCVRALVEGKETEAPAALAG